jgi:hypothetical protein
LLAWICQFKPKDKKRPAGSLDEQFMMTCGTLLLWIIQNIPVLPLHLRGEFIEET